MKTSKQLQTDIEKKKLNDKFKKEKANLPDPGKKLSEGENITDDNDLKSVTTESFTVKGVEFTMVWCPPGSFMMGSPDSEEGREIIFMQENHRKVTLTKGFWMLETAVTQELYTAVTGTNRSCFKGSKLPVEMVTWYDAVNFCNRLSPAAGFSPYYTISDTKVTINTGSDGFRLPTEAEWEYAARAGTTTAFHFGNRLDSTMANFNGYGEESKGSYKNKTTEVKSFSPNAWGLYDMHGNVWEWCWDWRGEYSDDAVDPAGPDSGSRRIIRGGSWIDDGIHCRSAYRDRCSPDMCYFSIGFRFARTP